MYVYMYAATGHSQPESVATRRRRVSNEFSHFERIQFERIQFERIQRFSNEFSSNEFSFFAR